MDTTKGCMQNIYIYIHGAAMVPLTKVLEEAPVTLWPVRIMFQKKTLYLLGMLFQLKYKPAFHLCSI